MKSIQIHKKKGMSIGDMYPAVLTVVMIGMILGVGLYVLSTVHRSIAVDYTGSQDAINTSTGTTTLTLAGTATEFYLVADTLTVESTNGTSFTNFTETTGGVITWGQNIVDDQSTLVNAITFTYNYDDADSPEEAITTTVAGVADFADWIAIIVVVIAAAIVLGVVLTSFGRRRNTI